MVARVHIQDRACRKVERYKQQNHLKDPHHRAYHLLPLAARALPTKKIVCDQCDGVFGAAQLATVSVCPVLDLLAAIKVSVPLSLRNVESYNCL